ncbi:branched-chain amino acid transport system II carrier protein [Frisingicoccus sp.]|uniref:branched-chain amino acid transport system II carrier protein n=1 Tax=Frisingicoccus sp. TaxID=1918627 RepID=UPI003AB49237
MMEKLSFKNRILIGLTLFSMFFGAGNLIFPPHLGAQAGGNVGPALMGFVLSAIGIPVLGVAAVALSDGLENLAQKVHPVFASTFTVLLYLSIGPFLAIPRTAGTSYEMAVVPFLKNGGHSRLFLCVYSVGFFMIAVFLALKPDKLTDRLGKILGPLLLILIGVVFIGCWLNSGAGEGAVVGDYADHPVSRGFLDGYQTMDTIAALNFGIIIAMNIRKKGVKKERGIVRETIFSGIVAGILLLAVYSALAWVGAAAGARFGADENGARTLSQMMGYLYGSGGTIILGAIFFIACLNTCTGLLSSCSEYFYSRWPKVSYRSWVLAFAGFSALAANAGLTTILKVSVPLLNVIYPMAIVLILLSFVHRWAGRYPAVYPWAVGLTGISSMIYALEGTGIHFPAVSKILAEIPLHSIGLGWLWAAAAGILLGVAFSGKKSHSENTFS